MLFGKKAGEFGTLCLNSLGRLFLAMISLSYPLFLMLSCFVSSFSLILCIPPFLFSYLDHFAVIATFFPLSPLHLSQCYRPFSLAHSTARQLAGSVLLPCQACASFHNHIASARILRFFMHL